MAYKIVNDDSLTSVANAIRVKGEISGTLEFPDGFVSAIQNLSPSGNDALVITLTDSAATTETYGYHWTPDCSYNDYYEAVNQQRPIGLKVNCTISDDAFARRINDSSSQLEYVIVEEIENANYNVIGLDNKHYRFTYSGVTLTDEYFTPFTWDATAVASDVASGKIFYTSDGREVGTATPPSGTYSITSNGIYNIVSFASVDVNVSGGGSGDHDAEDGIIDRMISGVYENSRVTNIGNYAFAYCKSLTTVSFPNATTIGGSYAFAYCSSLTTANFPNATSIGSYAFANCTRLTTASFPNATSIANYAFDYCKSLTTVSFPNATTIGSYVFEYCKSLTTASFPRGASFGGQCFRNCQRLESLYVLASSVATLGASAFVSTPMSLSSYLGYFGSIYVPASLVDSYKSATNWSVYSARITSYVE